jgi:ectoine hydroxylase-related dioxygenase (phytanoyl-CoA dioxygenase family)
MNELGYLIEDDILSSDECLSLLESIERSNNSHGRGGVRHLMKNAAVRNIADDRRLTAIASRFLGQEAIPYKATLFSKTGKANWLVAWHQDTALPIIKADLNSEWGPWSRKAGIDYVHAPAWALSRIVALRIQLDPSDSTNGPIRMIEGSHQYGVLSAKDLIDLSRKGREVFGQTDVGGVIAMSPLIVHASSKAVLDKPRRVLHIEYSNSLELGPRIQLAVA